MKKGESALRTKVVITNSRLQRLIGKKGVITMPEKGKASVPSGKGFAAGDSAPSADSEGEDSSRQTPEESCCDHAGEEHLSPPVPGTSGGGDSLSLFQDFMKEANREGLIGKRAKKLMAIALSITQGCKPCLIIHIKSARQMGISQAEIEEAASLAVAFGGGPAMMFYSEVCRQLKV